MTGYSLLNKCLNTSGRCERSEAISSLTAATMQMLPLQYSEQLTRKGYRIDYQMYLTNESDLRMTL